LNPDRSKIFVSSPTRQDQLWGPPSLLLNEYRGSVLGVKQPECEVNNLAPCSAEGKNEWSCTSVPPVCLQGMDRDNFTFKFFSFDSVHLV
jgi:hypothetical protein